MYKFPFETCKKQNFKQVCIFGAGLKGFLFQKQLLEDSDIINNAFIDNKISADNACEIINAVGVYKPHEFMEQNIAFDCIVLACAYDLVPHLCADLFAIGIHPSKIIMPELDYSYTNSLTPDIGDSWNWYYNKEDGRARIEYEKYLAPVLCKYPISCRYTLDFPSGRGRIAEQIYMHNQSEIDKIVCCDANPLAIDYCMSRFANIDVFECAVNEVNELHCAPIKFSSDYFTFIFSWDAMVHFSYKWLDFYIEEFYRMLQRGGYVLIHHSNLGSPLVHERQAKHEVWNMNPGWRTLISHEDVNRIAKKNGFKVVEQKIIDWKVKDLDCISILYKEM